MEPIVAAAAGLSLPEPVVEALVQRLARIGGSKVDDTRCPAGDLRLCTGRKIVSCDRPGYMQIKMGVRIDESREDELAGAVHDLAACGRIDVRSDPADLFTVCQ